MRLTKAETEKKAISTFLDAFWHNPDGVMGEPDPKFGKATREATEDCSRNMMLAAMQLPDASENGMLDLELFTLNIFAVAFSLGREFQKRQSMEESFK